MCKVMVLRDEIKEQIIQKISDGSGGSTEEIISERTIPCHASFNVDPAVMTAYGLKNETLLYVVTREELNPDAVYFFKNKKYTVRFQHSNQRLKYTTLIEVK